MRTATWSLAFLAGGALAAATPGGWSGDREAQKGGNRGSWEGKYEGNWGGKGWDSNDKWGHGKVWSASSMAEVAPTSSVESSAAPTSSVQSSSSAAPMTGSSSSSTSLATPLGPSSYTHTIKNSTSMAGPIGASTGFPTGNGPAPTTTVTDITTEYVTVCPYTSTYSDAQTTSESTFITTSTLTVTYKSTITLNAPSSLATQTSAPMVPATVVTDTTSVWTSVCPATTTYSSGASMVTATYQTVSTLTSTYLTTITVTVPAGPTGSTSASSPAGPMDTMSASMPAGPNQSTSTSVVYVTVTVVDKTTTLTSLIPTTSVSMNGPTSVSSTYDLTSTITSVIYETLTLTVPAGPSGSSKTDASTVEVDKTTVYTSLCPTTSVVTNGATTSTSTYDVVSTITSVIHKTLTVTLPAGPSGSSKYESATSSQPAASVTEVVTTYTTVCPGTVTWTAKGSVTTKTYITTSTITSSFLSTVTASTPAATGGWSSVQWGSSWISYSVPASHTDTGHTTGDVNPGWSSGIAMTSSSPESVSSMYTSSSAPFPTGSSKPSSSISGMPSGGFPSGSSMSGPSGSASMPVSSGVSASASSNTGSLSMSASSSVYGTGSASMPASSGVSSTSTAPFQTGLSSGVSSMASSSAMSSMPSSSGMASGVSTKIGSASGTAPASSSAPSSSGVSSASTAPFQTGFSSGVSSMPSSSGMTSGVSTKIGSASGTAPASSSAPSSSAPFSTGSSIMPASSGISSSASFKAPSSSAPSSSKPTAPTASAPSSAMSSGTAPGTSSSKTSASAPSSSASSKASSKAPSSSAPSSSKPSSTAPMSSAPTSSSTLSATSISSTSSTSSSASASPTCVPCEGQPGKDPKKWCGYTINDNYYQVTPKTCRTVTYDLEITNTTLSPDGFERHVLAINGQMPGPTIEANWGDTIIVNVKNSLQNNGTTIHWHGIRQNYTNEYDGVPSITQCAIAPGKSMTYQFTASNYGSSWYHSHFALQTYMGVFGPMIIHGPSSADYDEEQSIVLQDWSHATVDEMYQAAQTVGQAPDHGPRTLDGGLINGMGVSNLTGTQTGSRFVMNVVSGKRYMLRLVNVAIQSTFKFYIDGHELTVISNDFVPIKPYKTNIVNINVGQRYNVIFTANQAVGDYWMRSDNQGSCASMREGTNIRAIVRYAGSPGVTPISTGPTYTVECVDEPYASLVPVVPLNAGATADQTIDETVVVGGNGGTPNLYKWSLSGTTFQSQWGDPTLYEVVNNDKIPTYSGRLAIEVPKLDEWVYIIIETPIPVPHPIHLHGHDFLILSQGLGLYDSSVPLNTINPPRRDTALMPFSPFGKGGHLVLAFQSDNPGVWLMHCHIGWHASMGFALQIIENLAGIKDTVTDVALLNDTCDNWNQYATANGIVVDDSGI